MLKTNKIQKRNHIGVGADALSLPNTTKAYSNNRRGTGYRAQESNAITLIALVITIIVLIILVGVTLNLTLGENGIFVKSKEGVDKYKDEAQKEQNTLENIYQDMTAVTEGEETTPKEPVAYSELSIGDYVNYPVYYDNVATDGDNAIPKEKYANKWRIISIDKNNNEVKLISAGIPLSYYYFETYPQDNDGFKKSVDNLTTKFFETEITNNKREQYKFYKSGFKSENEKNNITTIEQVKNLFNNDLTKKTDTTPDVRSMMLEDFSTMWNQESIDHGYYLDDKYENLKDLLFIPRNKNEPDYWSNSYVVWTYFANGRQGKRFELDFVGWNLCRLSGCWWK